jgi:hypothetical protein
MSVSPKLSRGNSLRTTMNRSPPTMCRIFSFPGTHTTATEKFTRARQFLLSHRDDYEKTYSEFRWPDFSDFNWARDACC